MKKVGPFKNTLQPGPVRPDPSPGLRCTVRRGGNPVSARAPTTHARVSAVAAVLPMGGGRAWAQLDGWMGSGTRCGVRLLIGGNMGLVGQW